MLRPTHTIPGRGASDVRPPGPVRKSWLCVAAACTGLLLASAAADAATGIPVAQMTGCDDEFEDLLTFGVTGGLQVAIAIDDRMVYSRGFGVANGWTQGSEGVELVHPHHMMRIASMSKSVTALAINDLAEDGVFALGDLVFGVAGLLDGHPELPSSHDPLYDQVTVEHLLQHREGWSRRDPCPFVLGQDVLDLWPYPNSEYSDFNCLPLFYPLFIPLSVGTSHPGTDTDFVRFLMKGPPLYTPGTVGEYTNWGYTVLGEIIEQTMGMEYEDFVKNDMLQPRAIYDMHLAGNYLEDKREREVEYGPTGQQGPDISGVPGQMAAAEYGAGSLAAMDANGAWIASSRDLLRLLAAMHGPKSDASRMAGGGFHLFEDDGIADAMTTPHPVGVYGFANYGHGFYNPYSPPFDHLSPPPLDERSWVHGGSLSATATEYGRLHFTAGAITYSVLTNSYTGGSPVSALNTCLLAMGNYPDHDLMAAAPTVPASSLGSSSSNPDAVTLSWTPGNGVRRIVVAREAGQPLAYPLDGPWLPQASAKTDYLANGVPGVGDDLGNGNFIVYDGPGSSAKFTTREGRGDYVFRVYEYGEETVDDEDPLTDDANALFLLGDAPEFAFSIQGAVSNPSFEILSPAPEPGPPSYGFEVYNAGELALWPWTITEGTVAGVHQSAWGGVGLEAPDGDHALVLAATAGQGGAIELDAYTNIGEAYVLDFAQGVSVGSQAGERTLEVSVKDGEQMLAYGEFEQVAGWGRKRLAFTATGSQTTIHIRSEIPSVIGPQLDDVRLIRSLVNGSFEDTPEVPPNGVLRVPEGADAPAGYSAGLGVGVGGVDVVSDVYWEAADGTYSIDLNSLDIGSLTTWIETVPGGVFNVRFMLSGNAGNFSDPEKLLDLVASDEQGNGITTQRYAVDMAGVTNQSMNYSERVFTFTAQTDQSRIDFLSADLGSAGPVIDDVRVTVSCSSDAYCNDGIYCNGDEVCNAGSCEIGPPRDCQGGAQYCNETLNQCDLCLSDAQCDNGLYCDGVESCQAGACVAGPIPFCFGSTPFCDESLDACVECASAANCGDGLFCNGDELCSGGACVAAPPPDCQGGPSYCDESLDQCVQCFVDIDCDDGDFCDGTETCDVGACVPGLPPVCTGATPLCDPSIGACVECFVDSDCAASEVCDIGVCVLPAGFNIDFGSARGVPASSYGAAAGQAGVWNEKPSSATVVLLDVNGATPGANVGHSADNNDGAKSGDSTDTQVLLNDNFYSDGGNSWSVSVSDLLDGFYDVYVYAAGHPSVSTGDFTILTTVDSIAHASIPGDSQGMLILGTSYVVDQVEVASNSQIVISGSGPSFSGLSGIQIVPVPEPGSVAGLASGVGLLLMLRKYRSRIATTEIEEVQRLGLTASEAWKEPGEPASEMVNRLRTSFA